MDLIVVALSNWLAKEARNSEVFNGYPVKLIPNGVNSDIFKPRDRAYSRKLLNILQNKKVILFVSDSITNQRKGFIYLQKALEQIKRDDIVLVSIGAKNSPLQLKSNFIELGQINSELLMSVIYSAADIFVIPSLMDNLPNTVLESIMCGTPVIGFPVGGIPDMIVDGKNGFLTEEISVPALTKTVNKFLETSETFNREEIREDAVKRYDLTVQAKGYINLYHEILNKTLI